MIFSKKKTANVLFVIPSASINGAVIVLMNYFLWNSKRNSPEINIEILVQWGKDNNPDTFFKNKLSTFGKITFLEELDGAGREMLFKSLLNKKIDCVFYNSIISVETQKWLYPLKCPQIFFVHEMERLMKLFRLEENKFLYDKKDTFFIACSESVKNDLKKVLSIPAKSIEVIHEFIDIEGLYDELKITDKSHTALDNTSISNSLSESFTIGFSGTFELRKSADLLPIFIKEIKKKIKNSTIIWVGASPFNGEPGTYNMVMEDIKKAGLSNDVVLIPKGLGHYKYYQRFDVFIMPSREDPFPVVNIEMGALGVPIICFKGSGGAEEYAKIGGGVSVPFLDINKAVDEVVNFYENKNLLQQYKRTTPQMVKQNFILEVQAPKIHNIIQNFTSK